jgi:2-isopropylmalate synthase
MAIATRSAFFNLATGINTSRLYPTSRLVSNITGVSIPRNKAVVGENAFSHEAGIHQHGMLQHRSTYEIIKPEDVGLPRSSLVLGKHSGRHAFRERVQQLGFELDEIELNRVFEEFKALADRKKELFDGDIEALVLRAENSAAGPWSLEHLDVEAHTGAPATVTIKLSHTDGRVLERKATGDGPVDAAFKAIVLATGVSVTLSKFEVHAVTTGEDAQGEAVLYVEHNGRSYRGSSISTDIVEASNRALLEVINRIELAQMSGRQAGDKREEIARLARLAQSAV